MDPSDSTTSLSVLKEMKPVCKLLYATVTIKIALENGDFEVDTFSDAESALFAFKHGHYDLAILDVRMPGINGFQLCRKLREIDKS